jgi:uracil-DNA glycosylase
MAGEVEQQLRAYVEYLRDMGVHDFYRQGEPVYADVTTASVPVAAEIAVADVAVETRPLPAKVAVVEERRPVPVASRPEFLEPPIPKLVSFDDLVPLPESRVDAAHKAAALGAIQTEIGDCTRCPLAYAGRRTIVFGDGDANARLMFVGEGPGADEDTSGVPFVGKAGQLLNNMIQAMGLKREEVYIANIVKCRPPANRVPEPVEANTCDQFLLQQIDVVQPRVVVALGSTAAMYLLGVKQSLSALRGRWHSCRGAKLAVTYHPAFLLRDPRMKADAWKDLQMVMAELGLKAPSKG